MKEQDKLRRFLFDNMGIRGEWVKLERSWQGASQHQQGPEHVMQQLGQALAAVVMLSATIKFKGSIILQAQGHGALKTLVAQATEQRKIRGLMRSQEHVPSGSLAEMFGEGCMVLTIESEKTEPYQGIVPLTGRNIAEALETYFNQSEQLNTRIWLCADDERAGGLLLQELPGENYDGEGWERIVMLADTLTDRELLELDCETLLHRLFSQEKVRLFDPEPVEFQCNCSKAKIEATLESMGQNELHAILAEQGDIRVDCEFCGRRYRFDSIDVENIFSTLQEPGISGTQH
ncbi:MAG: Hsp33 family molecular chaperone HslO [Gammaproteobacteria bacterium]